MRKLQTLFKEFIDAPIQIYSGATFKKGLYDLLDVYANTSSGDLVIVKGIHDVGNYSIQLKDGVNWQFIGNPTINRNTTVLFVDGGDLVSVRFNGDFVPTTEPGFMGNRTIYLTNSDSRLRGFSKRVTLIVEGTSSTDVSIYQVARNDFEEIFGLGQEVVVRGGVGLYLLRVADYTLYPGSTRITFTDYSLEGGMSPYTYSLFAMISPEGIVFQKRDPSGTAVDGQFFVMIEIEVLL